VNQCADVTLVARSQDGCRSGPSRRTHLRPGRVGCRASARRIAVAPPVGRHSEAPRGPRRRLGEGGRPPAGTIPLDREASPGEGAVEGRGDDDGPAGVDSGGAAAGARRRSSGRQVAAAGATLPASGWR
jgi:hypothetical protein